MNFNDRFSMRTQNRTVFLDPNAPSVNLGAIGLASKEKVNVILSPSLYWVKKLSLPVKYIRDVKKLLPSIFEDSLPDGKYSYTAYKSGDEFLVFAYEDKHIIDVMNSKGLSLANVSGVYFAQSELDDVEGAVSINETQSLYVKDGIVVLVPCCWIEEKGDLDISDLELSKHKVTLQQFGHIVDNKSLYKIAAVLVAFIILVATEYFLTSAKATEIQTAQEELFAKYKLKSTMFQNKSMLKKYNATHEQQTKLREYISYILSMKLTAQQNISLITLKNKKLVVEITGVEQGNENTILQTLKAKKVAYKKSFEKEKMHLELTI